MKRCILSFTEAFNQINTNFGRESHTIKIINPTDEERIMWHNSGYHVKIRNNSGRKPVLNPDFGTYVDVYNNTVPKCWQTRECTVCGEEYRAYSEGDFACNTCDGNLFRLYTVVFYYENELQEKEWWRKFRKEREDKLNKNKTQLKLFNS